MKHANPVIYCVIPNYNGEKFIIESIESILAQNIPVYVVVVDNASADGSVGLIAEKFGKRVVVLQNSTNRGFAGGVNDGINYALEAGADFVALFNNDARADTEWLSKLLGPMEADGDIGITAGKLLNWDGSLIDSTGDLYSNWLLAFPRGRDHKADGQYTEPEYIFGATGGASLYRANMLSAIGLFDEDFFAYYEDVDISFRAQLAGWKVFYEPEAIAYHRIGATSSKMPGFAAYHTVKNVPMLWLKNLPLGLWWRRVPKFYIAYLLMLANISRKGNLGPVIKGSLTLWWLTPKKLYGRRKIMANKKVTNKYIASILYPDLPPDRHKLRKLRSKVMPWRQP